MVRKERQRHDTVTFFDNDEENEGCTSMFTDHEVQEKHNIWTSNQETFQRQESVASVRDTMIGDRPGHAEPSSSNPSNAAKEACTIRHVSGPSSKLACIEQDTSETLALHISKQGAEEEQKNDDHSTFSSDLFGSSFREMLLSLDEEEFLLASASKLDENVKAAGRSADATTNVKREAAPSLDWNDSFSDIMTRTKQELLIQPIIHEAEAFSSQSSKNSHETKIAKYLQISFSNETSKCETMSGGQARCGNPGDLGSLDDYSLDSLNSLVYHRRGLGKTRKTRGEFPKLHDILDEALSLSGSFSFSPVSFESEQNKLTEAASTSTIECPYLPQLEKPVSPKKEKGKKNADDPGQACRIPSPFLGNILRPLTNDRRDATILFPSFPLAPQLGDEEIQDPNEKSLQCILELSRSKKVLPSTKDLELRRHRQTFPNLINTPAFAKLSDNDREAIQKMLGALYGSRQAHDTLAHVKAAPRKVGIKPKERKESRKAGLDCVHAPARESPRSSLGSLSPGRKEKNLISQDRVKQLLTDMLLLKHNSEGISSCSTRFSLRGGNPRRRSHSPMKKKSQFVQSSGDFPPDPMKAKKFDLVIPRHDHLVSPRRQRKSLRNHFRRAASVSAHHRSNYTRGSSTKSLQEKDCFHQDNNSDHDSADSNSSQQPQMAMTIRYSQAQALASRSRVLSDIKSHRPKKTSTDVAVEHERGRSHGVVSERGRSTSPRKEPRAGASTAPSDRKGSHELGIAADEAPRRPVRRRSKGKHPSQGAGRRSISESRPAPRSHLMNQPEGTPSAQEAARAA